MRAGKTGARVLIVEDEALIALMLEDVLAEFGCRIVGTAGSIAAALPLAQDADIDLALLDVNIRGVPVDPVIAVLQRRRIPFLLVTGYCPAELTGDYAKYPILHKPLRPSHLVEAVRKLLPMTADA